ncbi:glycosyltransferase family 2 protein [Thermomicrobiaceae bacterium CFH 74404]|uniref:Glycosyltransferase family 2 protein n=1 Tax=Thermalbibacter longus TaxID=2951981 RepID=A0AA41WBN8_9BACT|nr:glycosyltransferase family 2 protein [Thermalbibacter longus]MCM8750109.1 glycosyltransferase family 2 protein [Thermalbibacter longus]
MLLAGSTAPPRPVVQADRVVTSGSLEAPGLSVVVPVYDEAESLPLLYEELRETLSTLPWPAEIIFVDDGSRDGSTAVLRQLFERDQRVQVIELRRNFGKAAALQAGFAAARGERIVTLDADLQDVPAEIPRLLATLEHVDLVSGWKRPRRDPLSKRLPSLWFNLVVRLLTGVPLHDFNSGLKAYRAEVLRELPLYGELHRYIPVLAYARGFRVAELPVEHRPRRFGRSKFGAGRFASGFFDLLTVLFLTQYTRRPLHLFGWFGLLSLGLGTLINAYLSALWFLGQPIGHRPLLTLGVLLMTIGAQFFLTGLLAELIAHAAPRRDYSVRQHLRHDGSAGEDITQRVPGDGSLPHDQ